MRKKITPTKFRMFTNGRVYEIAANLFNKEIISREEMLVFRNLALGDIIRVNTCPRHSYMQLRMNQHCALPNENFLMDELVLCRYDVRAHKALPEKPLLRLADFEFFDWSII